MSIDLNNNHIAIVGNAEWLKLIANHVQAAGAQTRIVTDTAAFPSQLQNNDRLDALIVGIGWEHESSFMMTPVSEWEAALKHNYTDVVLAIQAAARHMLINRTSGRIIVVSSAAGLKSYSNLSAMGTSLAALHGIARIAAVDLGAFGISINVVAAGFRNDHWKNPATADRPHVPGGLELAYASYPLGREVAGKDLGEICCFLASKESSYITGAVIPVDGGYSITKKDAGTVKNTATITEALQKGHDS